MKIREDDIYLGTPFMFPAGCLVQGCATDITCFSFSNSDGFFRADIGDLSTNLFTLSFASRT